MGPPAGVDESELGRRHECHSQAADGVKACGALVVWIMRARPSYCRVAIERPRGLHAYRYRLRHQLFGRRRHRRRRTEPGALRRGRAVPHRGIFPRTGPRPGRLHTHARAGGTTGRPTAPGANPPTRDGGSRCRARTGAAIAQRGRTSSRGAARGAAAVDGTAGARSHRLGRQLPARAVRRRSGGRLPGQRRRQPHRIAEVDVRLSARPAGAQGDRAHRHAYPRTHPPHRQPAIRHAGARRGDRAPSGIPQLDGRAGLGAGDRDPARGSRRSRVRPGELPRRAGSRRHALSQEPGCTAARAHRRYRRRHHRRGACRTRRRTRAAHRTQLGPAQGRHRPGRQR